MSQLLDFTPSSNKIRSAVQGMTAAEPQAEPGMFDKAWNSLKAIGEGVTRIPGGVADTLSDVAANGDIDVTDEAALKAQEERRASQQAYLQKYEGQAFSGVAGAMESMPYSLATMGGSILGGALAGPAGGMGAAGLIAARGTRSQFMQDMLDAARQALGRMPTEDEWTAISRAFSDDANAYALWEAVPEALTNSLFLKILGPVGKEAFSALGLKSALGRGAAELAATQLEEHTGETVTQWGQGGIEARAGLRDKAPTIGEAFGEQAPTTFWQTLLMHGGGKATQWSLNKLAGGSEMRPDGKAGAAAGLRSLVEGKSEADAMKPQAPEPGTNVREDRSKGETLTSRKEPYPSIPSHDEVQRARGLAWLAQQEQDGVSRQEDLGALQRDIRMRNMLAQREVGYAPSLEERAQEMLRLHQSAFAEPTPPAPMLLGQEGGQSEASPALVEQQGQNMPAPQPEPIATPVAAMPSILKQPVAAEPDQPHIVPINSKSFAVEGVPAEDRGMARRLYALGGRTEKTTTGTRWRFPKAREEAVSELLAAPSRPQTESQVAGMVPAMVKSTFNAGESHVATRQRRLEGTGDEIGQDAVPERGDEEGTAGAVPDGLGWPGRRPSEAPGDSEATRREGSVGDIRKEREGSGSRPEKAGRRGTSIKIPNRGAEPATYEVMEADEVQASHLPEYSFEKNPRYGLENERRYHDELASQRKVLENAARLDPDFVLKDSVDANNGAPVVDQDGNVLGGNGRAMSIRKAYLTGGERADAYRAALRDRAVEMGLNPASVDAMQRPMLVRRLDKAHSRTERQALVTAMNDSFTDSKSARASGKTRGDRLSRRSLELLTEGLKEADTLRQYFDEPKSAAAVEQLIRDGVIQPTERNAYVGTDGLLNPDGKRVVEEALRGRIARNYDALARLPSDVVGKLDAVIPSVLTAEQVGGPWSVTEPLRDAVDLLSEFRASGTKEPGVFLGQVNMLTGKTPNERYSPVARQLFTFALESKKADFSQRFRRYAAEAQRSPETNGLPGITLSQPEAAEKFLGIKPPAQTKDTKETDHVDHDSDRRLERNSQGNAAQDGVGEKSLSVDGKRDGGMGREGGRQAGEDVSAAGGEGLSGHATPAAGRRGDPGMGEKTSGIRERLAGSEHDDRGRSDGRNRLDVRRNGEDAVEKSAERSPGQRVANGDAHLREVQEALPALYPGQQEDVVFAEKRFRAGQGMVFTNGTGTGKTGLGLGVVSRLVRAGRREILIAVPADKIASDWITLGKKLGVPVSKLVDTKDAGKGVTVTTHANMAQNDALFSRPWDLIVIDESHKLSSSQQGGTTDLLHRLRGLALHLRGLLTRAEKTGRGPELTREIATLREKKEKELTAKEKERLDTLLADLRKWRDEVQAEIEAAKGPNRADLSRTDGKKPGVLLLSATPFAYEKSVDYAEGFLFDYPEVKSKGGYNQPNSYEQFMIEHFGYRMRYGKLTHPEAEVDAGLMQREFNSWLKKQGMLSSRNLDTPFDYDRRFILTENAIGQKIDEGLDFLFQNYNRYTNLHAYINKRFDYLAKRYLLEAIKARDSIDIIRENLRQGRKVVVFHQFNKGGGFNPFDVSAIEPSHKELYAEARAFAAERPDLVRLPLKNLSSPVTTLKEAFPKARVFSGLVSKKEREAAVKAFQTDEGGADVIIVQADAGEAGLSLHDTTGKHQRVLINLGLPTKPVTAIQQEGRIFRAGQQSNAMFRYLNTGTNWERYAFAQTIAQRASAAENLAMGEEARGLRDAFIQAFEDSGPADVGMEGEGTGGKARDRALQTVTSEFDRAKTFYFGQKKRNARNKAREGIDYFATPEPLGQKMVEWAAIEPGTDVLEPSAGHGAIARWFPETAKRTVVEPSAELSSRLMLATDAKLRNHPFEKLDVVNKYDSVIMNPPFGKGGKTAMEHLEKAFRHLRRNGRIVAIVPDGPSMQKRLDAFFDYDEKAALAPALRREIILPAVTFERAGTNVGGKVLIIDAADRQQLEKYDLGPAGHIELNDAKNIGELFDRIENMGAPERLGVKVSPGDGARASIAPGEYLPKVRRSLRPVKASAVRRVADALEQRAARAAQTEAVQSFDALPARLREEYPGKSDMLEGVYDPATGKVWLVADNLTSLERAADVWAHEQFVHHGLRGMLGEGERTRLLNRLWLSLGGMGNAGIRSVAERYGVNPRGDAAARLQVMEEYLAGLAERKKDALLSPAEETLWRRVVAAIREAWARLVLAVSGRNTAMGEVEVDRLLAALGRYVMTGAPEGVGAENVPGAPTFASVGEDRASAGLAAWEQVRKDTEEWERQLDEFSVREGGNPRDRLHVGHTPDVLIRLGAKALPMEMTRGNVHKVMDKHGVPLDVLRQLPGHLADPLMVFKSATMADAYVVLTEMRRNDENLVAAVHFDVEAGRMRINDIASIHDRSTTRDTGEKIPGWVWIKNQIAAGNLRYYDKTRSSRWFRELSGLQLSGVMNRESYRGIKILTEKDVVKPVRPETEKPLASLSGAADRVVEKIAKPKERILSGISAKEVADNPALAGVLEKIGVTKPTLAEKWANVKDTWKTTLEQGLFDRFASIKEYSETGYKMARMSTGLGSQLRAVMEFGAPVWRDNAMAVEGKGLQEIFNPVAGELDRFLHWMVGRRASRLMEEGRENLLTKRDIAALLELAEGKTADGKERRAEYRKVFDELAAFKGKVLDFAQAGGVIDPVGRAVWENADYIPFYRVQERMDGVSRQGPRNSKGVVGQNAGIRELKGGLDNLGDPLENLLQNFAHLIDAAQKNKAALQVFADLHKAGMAEQLTSERTKSLIQEDSATLADALEAENLLNGLTEEQKKSLLSVFAVRRDVDASRSKDGGVVYARYQGRPYLFKVTDPLLYRALTGMNDRGDTSGVMRFGRKFKRMLTTGVTIMPDFMVRNFLRDSVHSWVVEHKSGFKPLIGSMKGLRATLAMDEDTRQLFASGATFMGNGYRLGNDPEAARLTLERLLTKSRMGKEGFFKSLLDDPKKIASALTLARDKYENLGGAAENAVRRDIYASMRKKGYSHLDASFAARDIMDFSMRGEFAFIRTLTDLVPFLGARLTGLHRLGQGAMENPRAFAMKGGVVALAAVGLFLANLTWHKDEWDELEDWDKDSYFHFWVGGEHFRLPKPFEVGFLFGTIPERMAEQALTDAPSGVFWGRVFRGIADQLSLDPTPQAVKPILEDIANRDSFRNTAIVGQSLAGRLPTEQHTARTTMSARMFADAMDAMLSPVFGKSGGPDALRSPVRLEHLINGYFGGLGSTVLGLSDRAIRWLRDDPALPSGRGPEDWPLVRAFYRGNADTADRTRFEGELYDAMREADELAASLKLLRETGDSEAEAKLREEVGTRGERMLRERKALNRLRRDFAKFNRMMDAVYRDRTMSSSQKRLRLDELQRRKSELAHREWVRHREAMRKQ